MVAFQGQAEPELGRACIAWTLSCRLQRTNSEWVIPTGLTWATGCCLAALIRCGIEEVGACGEFHPRSVV